MAALVQLGEDLGDRGAARLDVAEPVMQVDRAVGQVEDRRELGENAGEIGIDPPDMAVGDDEVAIGREVAADGGQRRNSRSRPDEAALTLAVLYDLPSSRRNCAPSPPLPRATSFEPARATSALRDGSRGGEGKCKGQS